MTNRESKFLFYNSIMRGISFSYEGKTYKSFRGPITALLYFNMGNFINDPALLAYELDENPTESFKIEGAYDFSYNKQNKNSGVVVLDGALLFTKNLVKCHILANTGTSRETMGRKRGKKLDYYIQEKAGGYIQAVLSGRSEFFTISSLNANFTNRNQTIEMVKWNHFMESQGLSERIPVVYTIERLKFNTLYAGLSEKNLIDARSYYQSHPDIKNPIVQLLAYRYINWENKSLFKDKREYKIFLQKVGFSFKGEKLLGFNILHYGWWFDALLNSKNQSQPLWIKYENKWFSSYWIFDGKLDCLVLGTEASQILSSILNRNTVRVGGNTIYDSWWYRVYLGEKMQLNSPLKLDEIPSEPKNIAYLVNHIGPLAKRN